MAGKGPKGGVTQTRIDRFTSDKPTGSPAGKEQTGKTADSPGGKKATLDDVMVALAQLQTTVGGISTDVTLLRADLHKMSEKVKSMEVITKSLVEDVAELQREMGKMAQDNRMLREKLDEQEGRSRRNNIRIIGVPESEGVKAMDLFVENLITNELKPKGLSNFFSVERAHRVPGGQPKPGANPRPIVARLFNFRDRDTILQAARSSPPLKIQNATIAIFPDYTAEVARRRRTFFDVKKELRSRELPYSMLFPARLRVVAENKTWFFDCPENVQEWLEGWRPGQNHRRTNRSRKDRADGHRRDSQASGGRPDNSDSLGAEGGVDETEEQ